MQDHGFEKPSACGGDSFVKLICAVTFLFQTQIFFYAFLLRIFSFAVVHLLNIDSELVALVFEIEIAFLVEFLLQRENRNTIDKWNMQDYITERASSWN